MISRFVFVWLIAGGAIYTLAYLMTNGERKSVMRSSGRIAIVCVAALLLTLTLFVLNNVQGL